MNYKVCQKIKYYGFLNQVENGQAVSKPHSFVEDFCGEEERNDMQGAFDSFRYRFREALESGPSSVKNFAFVQAEPVDAEPSVYTSRSPGDDDAARVKKSYEKYGFLGAAGRLLLDSIRGPL